MNRDDIIRMAREVFDIESDSRGRETFIADSYSIERFAALVATAEREACALVCEAIPFTYTRMDYDETCTECAKVIRARAVTE